MTAVTVHRRPRALSAGQLCGVLALLAAAALLAPAAAATVPPRLLAAAALAVALVVVAYLHPPVAAYGMLLVTPLTAGIERDAVLPVLRVHEALGLLFGAGVALRALVQFRTTGRLPLRFGRLDLALALLATAGSVLPLLWMLARGLTPTLEDYLYAAALWKFYGLYALIRASIRTERQVYRCLWVAIAGSAVMGILAIGQSMGPAWISAQITNVYPLEPQNLPAVGRGSSTLGSAIGVGDVMAYSLAVCLGLALRTSRHRLLALAAAVLFGFGAVASGQFSGVIAGGIALFAVAALTGRIRQLLAALVPLTVVAAVVMRPVIQARLADLDISTGLPQSWWVRLENLRLYVWPELLTGYNWLFGVRPTAILRVDAPWAKYIFIESGHTWLLWTGGVPLLLAYLYFVWTALRTTVPVARARHDAVGVAAIAGVAALLVLFTLMSFDPHITMRGTADLLFSLLALATAVRPAPTEGSRPCPPPPPG